MTKKKVDKYIALSTWSSPISFSFEIERKTEQVTVIYEDGFRNEVFPSIAAFLISLSRFYRNRIDSVDDPQEKLSICNQFLDKIYQYKFDLRYFVKDEASFFKDIELLKEQFHYYKKRIPEGNFISQDLKSPIKVFTLKQQVLIMEYLGFNEFLQSLVEPLKAKASIVSALLGKDSDNIEKALRYVNGMPSVNGKDVIKTEDNLKKVLEFFNSVGLSEICDKVNKDIGRIKKG